MSLRVMIAAAGLLFAGASLGHADVINGTYTAVPVGDAGYLPYINYNGLPFLPSPFSQSLTLGQTTAPSTFLEVTPVNASPNVGTKSGSIDISMILTSQSGAAVTGVTTSAGGLGATLSGKAINFFANYRLFYGNETDCLVWNATSCTPNNDTMTIGETLTVNFADNTKVAINLYNWSDWDMQPNISFGLLSGPTKVPEPASLALLGTAVAGLWVARRRRSSDAAEASR